MEKNPAAAALHMAERWPTTTFNRIFAPIYLLALLSLFYHHTTNLLRYSTTSSHFFITFTLLLADVVLAFMWATNQAYRMNPIRRREMPHNLNDVVSRESLPGLDVFVCTADPYKEPPIGVVNTALSVMAYDYPKDKLSVYVSDDGGSQLTLFSFVEAAKFSAVWLPFCERNRVVDRNPAAYFESGDFGSSSSGEAEEIKSMYENMKLKVEHVLERGKVDEQYINDIRERRIFDKWTDKFTKQNHPSIIQVLVESSKDKDIDGQTMPNLIYVSRQKSSSSPHHFKAGALNVLLRVSATMTNAPIILTLDCDMYSNDPTTPRRAMCYFCDPKLRREDSAYVQFPQKYHGINENDIYAGEYARMFVIQPMGSDGLRGPNYVGTGCFFRRRVLFGGPSTPVSTGIPELEPDHVVENAIQCDSVLGLAHEVSGCDYENRTDWGSMKGFRYGSLVEDYDTGYRLICEGWKSIFCCPRRPAFLGDAPISLVDMINQQKRWNIGLLEVGISQFSTLTYGVKNAGLLMGMGYSHFSFLPIWSLPILVYSFIPQLALLSNIHIFPKVTEPWFWVYMFLFLGAHTQDLLDFLIVGGTIQRWWNDQRIWLIRGLTCHLFGLVEYFLKFLGIATGFNVTNKAVDEEQSKRYDQGIFEFGIHSIMFVPPTVAALINLLALLYGLVTLVHIDGVMVDTPLVQLLMVGFGVVNCWPIYEAVGWRSDKGSMHVKTRVLSVALALACYVVALFVLK